MNHTLTDAASLRLLTEEMANCRVVMLGEASHGSHEFYTLRTAISKQLIEEKGFRFIAIEGDWSDCYRINRYVKGYPDAGIDIRAVLGSLDRWPNWIWANWELAAFAEWLREFNSYLPAEERVGFYGLDLYSLWDSLHAMIGYLEKHDYEGMMLARKGIACFEPYLEDERAFSRYSVRDRKCAAELIALLKALRLKSSNPESDGEAGFTRTQQALIASHAEQYYRCMMGFDNEGWNLRDQHLMQMLEALRNFHGPHSKCIVWAHNTHIGDSRATDMAASGVVNLGQLAREKFGDDHVYLCGMSCYQGHVIAAGEWGAPLQAMRLPAARDGSIEARLHEALNGDAYILLRSGQDGGQEAIFRFPVEHRAVGLVYDPALDAPRNYIPTIMNKRYDAFVFLDQTTALHPLRLNGGEELIQQT